MKRELTSKQKERKIQTIITIALPLFFILFIGTMVLSFLDYLDRDKADNLASQYTESGRIERVILKKTEAISAFEFDTEEYYILLNNKKYQIPIRFADDVHKGSQVTVVGDRNGISNIEIEK